MSPNGLDIAFPECCDARALTDVVASARTPEAASDRPPTDPTSFVRIGEDGLSHLDLWVENLQCAACIQKIESSLCGIEGVKRARLNISSQRLAIDWETGRVAPVDFIAILDRLGYPSAPFDPSDIADFESTEDKRLLSALAVAGFAAANVMLLSVSVWSGHSGGMEAGTRTLFHWVSALIAIPAIAYAGQPFFRSALGALRNNSLNMDVPISLAVLLAAGMSLYQTMQHAEHAYFDASVMLLFFLLIGRVLDRRVRTKARESAAHLLGLQAEAATIIEPDGTRRTIKSADIQPGMTVFIASGGRIPADGDVRDGQSEIDMSLVTGESMPKSVGSGDAVYAGTLNLSGPLTVVANKDANNTLLAEIVKLMENAEQGRARFVRLADKVAAFYSPVVHILAAVTFLGWLIIAGAGWEQSMMAAVAVLIITCPCALGLVVPVVQVVASGTLLKAGVLVKSGDALEKMAAVDTVVFDKTGTLTLGALTLQGGNYDQLDLGIAAALAQQSRHPAARAIAAACSAIESDIRDVREFPGLGLEATYRGERVRLGRAEWCDVDDGDAAVGTVVWLSRPERDAVSFEFADELRPDAKDTIDTLKGMGLHVALISGDTTEAVRSVAEDLGIDNWHATCMPDEKVAFLNGLEQQDRKTLMVGDGLNDAPSLAAAHVSISPSSAADISQTAADMIFQGHLLIPVVSAIRTARFANSMVKQNFVLALLYNSLAVPLAMFGYVTPLIAAVAMSSSSIIVTVNALRLRVSR